ncbi:MAG: hypothetical protein RLZZ65_1701 [Bacteroidota bacterium]|jgi:hypothetical protein
MERLILLSLSLFLLFSSCKKGTGSFVIHGKVSDLTFSKALEGAELKFYRVPIGTSEEILLKAITLPLDGSYQFEVPRDKTERYIIRVFKNNYFPIEKNIYYSELSIKEANTYDLSTDAMAWVKLHFKNLNGIFGDQFRYIKQEGFAGCETCCPSTSQDFYGPTIDTTFYCVNKANSTYSIYYWEINTQNNGLKSAFTTPFDTTLIEVIY